MERAPQHISTSPNNMESGYGNDALQGLISGEQMHYIDIFITGGALGALYAFGIACNVIIIIVFSRQGLNESSTLTFFALAISDLGQLIVQFVMSVTTLVVVCYGEGLMDIFWSAEVVTVVTVWPRMMFTTISILVTVSMAVERSLTVVFPLKFKQIIKFNRTLCINVGIFVAVIIIFIPVYSTQGLHLVHDPYLNRTVLARWTTENFRAVEQYLDIFAHVFIIISSEIVVIIATLILIRGLKGASVSRQTLTHQTEKTTTASAAREANVMKMVLVVAVVFVLCNTPMLVMSLTILMVPEFSVGGRYEYTLYLVDNVTIFAYGINATANIFIYFRLSSKFRDGCKKLLPLCFRDSKPTG